MLGYQTWLFGCLVILSFPAWGDARVFWALLAAALLSFFRGFCVESGGFKEALIAYAWLASTYFIACSLCLKVVVRVGSLSLREIVEVFPESAPRFVFCLDSLILLCPVICLTLLFQHIGASPGGSTLGILRQIVVGLGYSMPVVFSGNVAFRYLGGYRWSETGVRYGLTEWFTEPLALSLLVGTVVALLHVGRRLYVQD
jgi:hypothetical protein